mmetsp:Transcript_104549/g.336945  ORF Transcript_104549/g.336945 Transcript_104549/m.336945 type:complete len:301 (+) Transcript_104549:1230-2132(+)
MLLISWSCQSKRSSWKPSSFSGSAKRWKQLSSTSPRMSENSSFLKISFFSSSVSSAWGGGSSSSSSSFTSSLSSSFFSSSLTSSILASPSASFFSSGTSVFTSTLTSAPSFFSPSSPSAFFSPSAPSASAAAAAAAAACARATEEALPAGAGAAACLVSRGFATHAAASAGVSLCFVRRRCASAPASGASTCGSGGTVAATDAPLAEAAAADAAFLAPVFGRRLLRLQQSAFRPVFHAEAAQAKAPYTRFSTSSIRYARASAKRLNVPLTSRHDPERSSKQPSMTASMASPMLQRICSCH